MNGAFSCALSWASRLALPIHGIGIPLNSYEASALSSSGVDVCLTRPGACQAACASHGVTWRYSEVSSEASVWKEVDAAGLLALSQTIPPKLKRELLGTMRDRATLVCPSTNTRVGRMLVLDHDRDAGPYLVAAVELCHQIGAMPIVLTIGRSMHAATEHQQWAQTTVHAKGLNAEFDLLVGLEIRNTVLAIARWRRCQLVVMDCQQSQSWCRWLRGPEGFWTVNPTQSMAFLTLRERAIALPSESARSALLGRFGHRASGHDLPL